MGGFVNDNNNKEIVFADNVNFSGDGTPTGKMTTNGQLLIGSTANPNIQVGTITSPFGTVNIGYSSPNITLDISGASPAIEKVNLQTGTSPIIPTGGTITFNGATVAAGTNPVRTDGTGPNTMALEVQISQAIASTNATNIGLSAYNNGQFTVDANGFVSSKAGSFTWVDVTSATQNISVQTGYVTDHTNVTYTLPATANLGDQFRIVGKLGITTIAQNANQQIVVSSASSTVGVSGSVAGTNVGDCMWLVCITAGASTVWRAENFVGNWTVT